MSHYLCIEMIKTMSYKLVDDHQRVVRCLAYVTLVYRTQSVVYYLVGKFHLWEDIYTYFGNFFSQLEKFTSNEEHFYICNYLFVVPSSFDV